MDISSFRSLFLPHIDDIVFRVALEYENLYKGQDSKLDVRKFSPIKRNAILAKNGIGYLKRDSSEYVIYLLIIRQSTPSNGDGGVMAGRNFRLKEGRIAFTGPPMRLQYKHYKTPSVYSSEEVCYRSDGRWERIGIRWNYWYDITDETTPFKIAKWLEQGKLIIRQ